MRLRVITPEGVALDCDALSVRLQAADGRLGVRDGHCDALVALAEGITEYDTAGGSFSLRTGAGFAIISGGGIRIVTPDAT